MFWKCTAALLNLKQFNPFYSDILIDVDNINKELLSVSDIDAAVNQDEFSITIENDDENLENDNPQNNQRTNSNEMCIIPNIYSEDQNLLNIAPGQNKNPSSFFNDEFCEEQAFPYLLPKGKFGYKIFCWLFLFLLYVVVHINVKLNLDNFLNLIMHAFQH